MIFDKQNSSKDASNFEKLLTFYVDYTTLEVTRLSPFFYEDIGNFGSADPKFKDDDVEGVEVDDPINPNDLLEIYVFAKKNIARFHQGSTSILSYHTQGFPIEKALVYKTQELMIMTW